jgi:hypothetical protein
MQSCESPFWNDPAGFVQNFSLTYKPHCKNQIWNFLVRLLLLGFFVGLICVPLGGWLSIITCLTLVIFIGFVIIVTTKHEPSYYPPKLVTTEETQLTPIASSYRNRDALIEREAAKEGKYDGGMPPSKRPGIEGKEGFTNPRAVGNGMVSRIVGVQASIPNVDASPYAGPSLPDYTPPSARNPFMNVLLDEYKYNPERPQAASVGNSAVKQTLDDYFRVQWFSDPTDVFGRNQSQRQFVTQPSTSIPNDRDSYQNWLYKIPGKTCKEGGRDACLAGTDGGPITWLNMDL